MTWTANISKDGDTQVIKDLELAGIDVLVSGLVPDEGCMYAMDFGAIKNGKASGSLTLTVGTLTYWRMMHPGREPFLSRYCAGVREYENHQRRRRKNTCRSRRD